MMVPKKWKKRESDRPQPRPTGLVSIRRPGVPVSPFLEQIDVDLAEVKADFRRQTGSELPGNGVLFAHDVLVALHGDGACWERFDVAAFERFIHTNVPPFAAIIPHMLCDLAAFSNYLVLRGRFPEDVAAAIALRTFDVLGVTDEDILAAAREASN